MIIPVPILKPGQVSCLTTNDSKTPYTVELVFSNPKILPALISVVVGASGSKAKEDTMVKVGGRDVSSTITRTLLPGQSIYAVTRNRDIGVSLEMTICDSQPAVNPNDTGAEVKPISDVINMRQAFEAPDDGSSLSLNDPTYKAMAESFFLGQKEAK